MTGKRKKYELLAPPQPSSVDLFATYKQVKTDQIGVNLEKKKPGSVVSNKGNNNTGDTKMIAAMNY